MKDSINEGIKEYKKFLEKYFSKLSFLSSINWTSFLLKFSLFIINIYLAIQLFTYKEALENIGVLIALGISLKLSIIINFLENEKKY